MRRSFWKRHRNRWKGLQVTLRERICFHHQPRLLISSCGSSDTLRKREISGLRLSNRAGVVSIFTETFFETSRSRIVNRTWSSFWRRSVPPVILCIGLNYRKHAAETGAKIPEYPVLFLKSPGTLQNPGDPIVLPTRLRSDEVDYECELAVVIGRKCKNVSKSDAFDVVFGYTAANDVSARDWQKQLRRRSMVPR